MSDASEKVVAGQEGELTTSETTEFDWTPLGPDEILQTLVDLTNTSKFTLGISLNIGAFLVSGNLISGRAYFDGVASEMANVYKDHPGASDAMRKFFSEFGDVYNNVGEDENRKLPVYLHLSDARFFHNAGQPFPGNRGVFWRGRISCVSGFFIGTLSTDK
jgi:hypothetical protein